MHEKGLVSADKGRAVNACRFDFVKGYDGSHVRDYVEATAPYFVIGEFWDTLSYEGALPKENQDAHRQRTINWLNAAGGRATAFDVTLKGILHAVFEVGDGHDCPGFTCSPSPECIAQLCCITTICLWTVSALMKQGRGYCLAG